MCDSTRDLRLDQIIADYLEAVAAGQAPSEAQWLAAHPNEADALREFLANYRGVDGVVSASCDDAGGAPASGRRFGDYELLEEIGRGGMGVIHKARQRGLDRVVAVKMILDGQLASAEQVQRFLREARSAARLEHPNIVTVHEVGVQDGRHFFSMAYVAGRPLSELTRERPLPPRDAARLVKAIAGAIAYAHSQGVLHRDLKPSNILVDADGEPRITDFGLAKLAGESVELTATGAVVGTPAYMPPEQAAGRIREVGAASDVYSIGAILYTTLTGSPPFSGETAAEVVNNVVHARVTPPRLINAAVPDALQVICLRCLEQAPARRYSSARELEEDLRRYLDDEPILARPPGYLERAWRWTRRRNLAGRLKLAASTWGLFIGLALAALFWGGHRVGLPLLDPTRPMLDDVAGVAALMAVWWLSEAIPLAGTALLPLVLFPLLGVMPASTVARHYGDDVIFLFLGGFLVALAVEDSGLPRRAALRIIAALGDSPRRIVLAFMIATGLLSMWTSNSAVTIMMLPIAIGLLEEVERDLSCDTRALGPALMLGIAYAASIAGTATVIGSPVNVAALAQAAGIEISFTQWMSVGLPFAALQLGATWALLAYRLFPLGAERFEGGQVAALRELQRLGTMKPAEKRALAVFALTALLWIFRAPHEGWGWGPAIFGVDHEALVSDGTVAVAMALLCLIVPDGTPSGRLLRWEATARMPWGVLFLFGGGLALAAGMRQGGLVDLLDDHLAAGLGALTTGSALVVLAGAILLLAGYAAWARGQARRPAAWGETLLPPGLMAGAWVVLAALRGPLGALLITVAAMTTLTEIFTNLATVELVTRVLANAAEQLDLGRPLVLASTMAASCAFLLPVSTTPNAVVFGSRRVSARQMARAGFWVDVVGAFVLIAVLAAYVRLT